ncbi:MAG: hypothetical protein RMM30_09475 [Armatimonadota bacterium]|nr:LPS export ABC transporter periplasmic protein LptC [Armatimonadota bacterium]MDW8156799.1 hypothetical protein [Armatimonadota bacterium]
MAWVSPRWAWSLAGLALVGAGYLWAARAARTEPPGPEPSAPVRLEAEETRLVVRHQGTPQVDLQARRVEVSPDLMSATLEDVRRAVVFREGQEFLYVKAGRIRLNRQTQNFVATGGVEVTSPKGDWLRAPELVYHNDRAVLSFPRGVEFQLGNTRARVRSLRYFVKQDVVEMEGGVDLQLDTRPLPSPSPAVRP